MTIKGAKHLDKVIPTYQKNINFNITKLTKQTIA